MRNPDEHCPKCDWVLGFDEESCPECGFDPVNNEEDAKLLDEAWEEWRKAKKDA